MPSAGRPCIDPAADWETLLDLPVRRAIVRACGIGAGKTPSEIAVAISRERRGIETTVKNLCEWGFLEIVGYSSRGAKKYRTSKAGIAELRRWMRCRSTDFVRRGQQTVEVAPPAAASVAAEIVEDDLGEHVEWALSLGPEGALVIGLVDHTQPTDTSALLHALQRSGHATVGPIADVVAGENFSAFVRGARAATPPPDRGADE